MTPLQYDEVIRGLLMGWFRMHGADSKIPDFMHHDHSFSDMDRDHFLRLYAEARMRWDKPIVVPEHVAQAVLLPERIAAAERIDTDIVGGDGNHTSDLDRYLR